MSTKKAKVRRPEKSPAARLKAGRAAYMAENFAGARDIWLPLAGAGDAEAQAWIGSLYANGDGVDINDGTAFRSAGIIYKNMILIFILNIIGNCSFDTYTVIKISH